MEVIFRLRVMWVIRARLTTRCSTVLPVRSGSRVPCTVTTQPSVKRRRHVVKSTKTTTAPSRLKTTFRSIGTTFARNATDKRLVRLQTLVEQCYVTDRLSALTMPWFCTTALRVSTKFFEKQSKGANKPSLIFTSCFCRWR